MPNSSLCGYNDVWILARGAMAAVVKGADAVE